MDWRLQREAQIAVDENITEKAKDLLKSLLEEKAAEAVDMCSDEDWETSVLIYKEAMRLVNLS